MHITLIAQVLFYLIIWKIIDCSCKINYLIIKLYIVFRAHTIQTV